MAGQGFASTPQWLKLVVGLGVVTTIVVAVKLGFKSAVVTATMTFLALGAELATAGALDDEPEQTPQEPSGRWPLQREKQPLRGGSVEGRDQELR